MRLCSADTAAEASGRGSSLLPALLNRAPHGCQRPRGRNSNLPSLCGLFDGCLGHQRSTGGFRQGKCWK